MRSAPRKSCQKRQRRFLARRQWGTATLRVLSSEPPCAPQCGARSASGVPLYLILATLLHHVAENMNIFRPRKKWEFSHNAKIKTYPDYFLISVCNTDCYVEPGFEARDQNVYPTAMRSARPERSRCESMRRARAKIKDIALCTPFTHFVTLTLDKEKIDRYNYSDIMKKMRVFLSNAVERKGFAYIIVPEFHKDGAVHFHGLYRSERDMGEVCSGKKTKAGQDIFNLSSWKFGFSTSIPLVGDYEKVVSYILKYIGKDSKKVGGRWYLSGGNIVRPAEELADISFDEVEGDIYEVPDTHLKFKYIKIPRGSKNFDKINQQIQER